MKSPWKRHTEKLSHYTRVMLSLVSAWEAWSLGRKVDEATGDPNEKIFYINVEVEANKNHEQHQAKWHNAFQASSGETAYYATTVRACDRFAARSTSVWVGRLGNAV